MTKKGFRKTEGEGHMDADARYFERLREMFGEGTPFIGHPVSPSPPTEKDLYIFIRRAIREMDNCSYCVKQTKDCPGMHDIEKCYPAIDYFELMAAVEYEKLYRKEK